MAKMLAVTVGDFNRVWTRFSRQFPPGSHDASRINPRFCRLAAAFNSHFPAGVNRIDFLSQNELLPAAAQQACLEWLKAVDQATGRDYLGQLVQLAAVVEEAAQPSPFVGHGHGLPAAA